MYSITSKKFVGLLKLARMYEVGLLYPSSTEHLPNIFDRFYQVESVDTRAQEGTGISLALLRERVQLHHGTITVDSSPGSCPGAGDRPHAQRCDDAYLAKPFHKEELLIQVQNLIELRRQLQARYRDPDALAPTEDPAIQMEDAFIRQLTGLIETHLSDETFRVPQICRAIGMSQAQLYRKIKALTGQSAGIFVRSVRLRKALHLLRTSSLNVSEVAYEVGFKSPVYFSQMFRQTFGESPSDIRK
jgi:AraC-like DNA-binding protein